MELPPNFRKIINDAVERNRSDPVSAIDEAEEHFRNQDNFDTIVNQLVRKAVSDLIYQRRHDLTTEAKRVAREYGKGAKVKELGIGVQQAIKTWYDSFYIGGKVLGELTGADVKKILRRQRRMVTGHLVNIQFLEWLDTQKLPQDARIRDTIKLEDAMQAYKRIEQEVKQPMI